MVRARDKAFGQRERMEGAGWTITRAGTVGTYVRDQDRALGFYVDVLGLGKRLDEPMSPDARWIEVPRPPPRPAC
jgi:hypothetical protein